MKPSLDVERVKNMRRRIGIILLTLLLPTIFTISLLVGPYKHLNMEDVVKYFTGDLEGVKKGIIHYRLIRSLAALVAGAALASSGLTIQYVLRNPLADPYLLGIASGAALGVLVLIYFSREPPVYSVYTVAFASGLASFGAVVIVSSILGLSSTALIVAGVSISYLLGGASMIVIVRLGEKLPGAAAWLFGTVAYVKNDYLVYTTVVSTASIVGMILLSRRIATLILGEEMSRGVGVNVNRLRIVSSFLASLAASSVVAMAGPIGFIGLAGPWLARLVIGSWFPSALLASIVAGGILTLISDVSVRLIGGGEIPLTAVSSIYGGLVLFYLTSRTGREL